MKRKLPQSLVRNFLLTSAVAGGFLTLNTAAKPLLSGPLLPAEIQGITSQNQLCQESSGGKLAIKTELFFGLSKPGGEITNAEFQRFLNQEITPRFPSGLTLLDGQGQFKTVGGKIIAERSRVLILLYPFGDRESHQKIEQIRARYQKAFQQESVLRIDERICAAF